MNRQENAYLCHAAKRDDYKKQYGSDTSGKTYKTRSASGNTTTNTVTETSKYSGRSFTTPQRTTSQEAYYKRNEGYDNSTSLHQYYQKLMNEYAVVHDEARKLDEEMTKTNAEYDRIVARQRILVNKQEDLNVRIITLDSEIKNLIVRAGNGDKTTLYDLQKQLKKTADMIHKSNKSLSGMSYKLTK